MCTVYVLPVCISVLIWVKNNYDISKMRDKLYPKLLTCRKRWVLFPPEDGDKLYPSRIPFEESSVFSQVNILKPDIISHPKFKVNTLILFAAMFVFCQR